ncbi:hypothetical protein [Paraglaciecola arctica]|uniref:Pyridoxamine 5'-phosphate oxidase putative domain-containing protein n=1 Tax=Paraglaciecola arctica BSs20135 TaxID=493475 RepID=K6XBG8_9ALTE|nr:hypothetical protein [Paraglaciecola arctica]GAC17969.1 hypothetical protein GARC_0988 [Paraglaciecola arctica BSs20135]|tara:strand:+ start:413 stop:883 length:471 start_codon:yes stop_codon:yes gene_type:complete
MIAFKHIKNLVKNSLYCSISTIQDNLPHCSPIGSVYLESTQQGYYLEMFSTAVKKAQSANPNGCILVVNTSIIFWLKSLIRGKFATPPAVRLLVEFGDRRAANDLEQSRFRKKVNIFKRFKGHKVLWSNPSHVREFYVLKIIPVSLGKMTQVDYNQ